MTDELLVAQAAWLPSYRADDVEAARARLARHEAEGTRVRLREGRGAARRETRDVEALAKERDAVRASAMTSDKGEITHESP